MASTTIDFMSSLCRAATRSTLSFPHFVPSSNSALSSALSSSYQCRPFSQSLTPRAKGMMQTRSVKPPAEPSLRSRMRELNKGDLSQDIGVLPGTFIKPEWKDMPSIFQQPRERIEMEWLWIKQLFQNTFGILIYSKWYHKLPLQLRQRNKIARILHRNMYTAFAAGDIDALRKTCMNGLTNSLTIRINKRPKNEKVTWSLDKYIRSPSTNFTGVSVVSDRATPIQEYPDSGIRQVVLRITSRQTTGSATILKIIGRGKQPVLAKESPPKLKTRDCTEYIVMQKFLWFGEEKEWKIWGHTTPTTVKDLDTPWFAKGLTLMERLSMIKDLGQKRS